MLYSEKLASYIELAQARTYDSQATTSEHRAPHSVQVTVRVRVGWPVSGGTAE